MDSEKRVKWVYSAKNNRELSERYDQWAHAYDQDLTEAFGYVGPRPAVEYFTRFVSEKARILDAGAGTGLVGELLHQHGYNTLVAMDLSPGMLEEARKKQVYTEFYQMVLGESLDFPTDSFDAIISVGVFTEGHAPANAFDELVRITKPAGYIVFTLRADIYESGGFKEKSTALERAEKWAQVEVSEQFQALPKGEPDVYLQVWVYKVLA